MILYVFLPNKLTKVFFDLNQKSMKSLMKPFLWIAVVGLILSIASCKGDDNTGNKKDDTGSSVTEITNDNLTFYLIPSPKDMFSFTNSSELDFSSEVLNSPDNADKYMDIRSQELGFGIYSADLAYSAAFFQTKEAKKYLKVVRGLSDQIGIASVFDKALVTRFDEMPDNRDSLIQVTNDTYFDIVKFLEENERKSSLALISTGGWLESLYIVVHLVDKYEKDSDVVQLIADQKNIFENLVLYLEQHKNDPNVSSVIEDLQPIKDIYDKLEVKKVEKPKTPETAGKIVVGGTTKIVITEEQFNKLKQTISSVRNKLSENNV